MDVGNETASPPVVEMPQPLGMFAGDLLKRSDEYLLAFRVLSQSPDAESLKFSQYFLFTHALELLLKAFLAAEGMTKSSLKGRKIRHDLVMLFDRCVEHGLLCPPEHRFYVEQFQEMNSDYDFRYPSGFNLQVPSPRLAFEFFGEIHGIIAPLVQRASSEASLDHVLKTARFPKGTKISWSD